MRRLIKLQAATGGLILLVAIAAVAGSQGAGGCTAPGGTGPVGGVPSQYATLFQDAVADYNLGPDGASILAGIMDTESSFGTNNSTSSAGAEGPMQFEPGTWATEGVAAPGHTGPPNIQDPADAIYSAAHYLHDLGLTADPSTWPSAVFGYNHSASYVSLVLSRAQQFYANGVGKGGSAVLVSNVTPTACLPSPGGYVNPFARAKNLVPQRIDMGVDYDGDGPILAVGRAQITYAGPDPGWAGGNSINYKLLDGPYAGRNVYVAEAVVPTVSIGMTVPAGAQIATFGHGFSSNSIETGWAAGPGLPNALSNALHQADYAPGADIGSFRTYCGQQFSDLLRSLGAPGGLENQPLSGTSCSS